MIIQRKSLSTPPVKQCNTNPLFIFLCRIPPVHWKGVTQPQQWSLTGRPGNNSRLSGILGFVSEIFCKNAVVTTQEIVIVHRESLESELLTEH